MKKLPYQDKFHVALKYIIGDLNRANDMKILKKTFTEANLIWLKEKKISTMKNENRNVDDSPFFYFNNNSIFKIRQSNLQ